MAMRRKAPRAAKVSYFKKPEHLSTDEWQRELRRAFVADNKPMFIIKPLEGEHPVFTDYLVENKESHGLYKVALRSRLPGPNFCTCLDFKTNSLGTCKHIEAVLLFVSKNKKIARFLKHTYRPSYSSLFLKYGPERTVMLRLGVTGQKKLARLARDYFDHQFRLQRDAIDRIDHFLAEAVRISPTFRCYQDALDFIIKAREEHSRKTLIDQKIGSSKSAYFNHLLKTILYPYQKEGILFAVRAGRCLIADDMGLGKTLQALGAAELYKKEFGITRVLIVCPTSLKYQWKSEIEKFTSSSASVVEGNLLQRQTQYGANSFYKIVSYQVVGADSAAIKKMGVDLVILDEAQRIKNWNTKTAREVKKIESRYAVVLTGTPLENKLEELYSIIQFIDPYALGPLYQFLDAHQIKDESGKVVGYRELHRIRTLLSAIVIRRTKKEVLQQLPGRTDKNLFVPLTSEQADLHADYADQVARLVNKWKRFKFLDEKDRQRLLAALNCMRMVSDSTYILDEQSRHDTKIAELMCILDNFFATGEKKVVIFSQWERMTRLVKGELQSRQLAFAHLHGGVPSRKRKGLLEDFHQNPACRVFLSTDAGGVGLNLQCASLLINLDLPWNPAVLEQRIGRIYRHGQKRAIHVINLISRDSIEQRMLEVLRFKASLFAGVLDGGEDQIFMGENKFQRFMSSVEKITGTLRQEPAPVTDVEEQAEQPMQRPAGEPAAAPLAKRPTLPATELFAAAGDFLNTLSRTLSDRQKTEQLVASLMVKDERSGKAYLKIPVGNEQVISQAVEALASLLSAFRK